MLTFSQMGRPRGEAGGRTMGVLRAGNVVKKSIPAAQYCHAEERTVHTVLIDIPTTEFRATPRDRDMALDVA